MLRVQNLARSRDIDGAARRLSPGELENPIEVRADDGVLWRRRRRALQAVQFAVHLPARVLREGKVAQQRPKVLPVGQTGACRIGLVVDRGYLPPHRDLGLAARDFAGGFPGNAAHDLANGDVVLELDDHAPQLPGGARLLQERLPRLRRHRGGGREQVRELAWVGHALHGARELTGELVDERNEALEELTRRPD